MPLPSSAVNREANQISAANQHFISTAIWPSANCVSFKPLSISSPPPTPPFSLKKNVPLSFLALRGGPHGDGGCLLTTLS